MRSKVTLKIKFVNTISSIIVTNLFYTNDMVLKNVYTVYINIINYAFMISRVEVSSFLVFIGTVVY